MIFVERTQCPPSLDLGVAASAASLELEACKKHWNDTGIPPPTETFQAYKGGEVRPALTAMFKGKCAYCESPVSGSSQTDIEHYRPKGGISDSANHPGYWWLAMDWGNLVLSCMHCNQGRRQLILDPDMTEDQIREAIDRNDLTTTGKRNAFPTEGGLWVTDFAGSVDTEKPLLLDPTRTDPEPLVDWVLDGMLSTIRAKDGNERAEKTIDLLGLNRRYLTEARVQTLNDLHDIDAKIDRHLRRIAAAETQEDAEDALGTVNDFLDLVIARCDAAKPYAGLARAYLSKVEAKVAAML
ncbi:MAG TPA: hypothetical protein VFP12_17425 [Allosphingosinicella sp.]|nr:hypothetical protein [Allosphingosinicella sp.]